MDEQTPEAQFAGEVAKQLNSIRRRGLHRIDNRDRIEAPETELLARDYYRAKALTLHGRIAQITRLLHDGLEAYGGQGNEYDRQLINRLFFDPLITGSTTGPTDVLKKMLEESGKDESDFRTERHERFGSFAEFLVAYVTDAVQEAARRSEPEDTPEPPPPPPLPTRSRLLWIVATVAALVVIGGTLATVFIFGHRGSGTASTPPPAVGTSPHQSSPPYVPGKTYTEQEGHIGIDKTYANPTAPAETGPGIQPLQKVEVSCKVYAPSFPSVNPDGYWYRLASPPYNNRLYAIANTFLNGDPVEGTSKVVQHNTDFNVPDCPSA